MIKYQPSSEGDTCSLPATPHRLPKWSNDAIRCSLKANIKLIGILNILMGIPWFVSVGVWKVKKSVR